ncbi:DMT family transporter [Fictibacillus terranigra]|uniref:DMT family transporter n=1 Tax=Fictibacillus terranigra TaxID=3058424 RepID=A0ABT8E5T1_9BACL|nr:DMT family transporter [Fictibacillus sp. CENA-BCM004]MDN4073258.1 DMT family transporter [Fictibacillus sp. CENA-BCM004]
MKRKAADSGLLLVALVWGTTFVIVQNAVAFLPPFAFNSIRFFLAALILGVWTVFSRHQKKGQKRNERIWHKGISLGFWLYLGYGFQTVGLVYTTSSKTAFITGLSVVVVPVMAAFLLKQRLTVSSAASVIMAAAGLYLLTGGSSLAMNKGDFFVLLCAFSFGMHIVMTAKFASGAPVLWLTLIQLAAVSVLSMITSLFLENFRAVFIWEVVLQKEVVIALIVTAIFATALAFLAQTYFQAYTTPARVALIFALEPVFGALTAYLWANETLGAKGITGCILILAGMVAAEFPFAKIVKKRKTKEWVNS